ncbi:MAG: serine/threonine protein kinase with sensor(s) [Frankiales bacterium]|nr:serine/threonine protein kinase with sensor(s) [Frankiales bacterium]
MVEPGRRCLGDRYELSQLIAAGGMGQVWRGVDVLLGRPVAVKVLRNEYTGDPTFLARFRAEAQHAASLSHPNIAAVFDYGEVVAEDGSGETLAYLVMELVEAEPLSSVLRREGRLDAATTLALLQQTAFALAEAHRVGLVHRDVKPGNILVRPDGSVKITDFGIAWSAASVPLTRTGQVIGTPQYLSPEQAEGHLATPASDVYALGLVGYECLTGRSAFEGDNPVTIALKQLREQPAPLPAELPPGVRTLIGRALAKDPAVRLPDGAAFVAAVEDALSGREIPEAPATVAVPVPPETALPGDATRTTGGVRVPPPRRRLGRRLALVLIPVLTLLTGAAVAAVVVQGLAGNAPSTPTVAAQTKDRTTYTLDAADYIGRPVDEVAMQLAALGLSVHRQADPASLGPSGTVTAVDPVGRSLHPGDVVTLTYASGVTGASTATGTEDRRASRVSSGDQAAHSTAVPAAGSVASGAPVGNGSTSTSTAAESTTPPSSDSTTPTTAPSTSSSDTGAPSSSPSTTPPEVMTGG